MNGRYLHLPPADTVPCDVCGDPGRPVVEDGYKPTDATDGYAMCASSDESHETVRATFELRDEMNARGVRRQ